MRVAVVDFRKLSRTSLFNITLMPENVRKAIEDGENESNYGRDYQAAMMEYYKKHVCRLDPWPDLQFSEHFLNNFLDVKVFHLV